MALINLCDNCWTPPLKIPMGACVHVNQSRADPGDYAGRRSDVQPGDLLQASAGARKYAGEPFLRHLIEAACDIIPLSSWSCTRTTAPIRIVCQRSIRSGFSSVMMDGSLM